MQNFYCLGPKLTSNMYNLANGLLAFVHITQTHCETHSHAQNSIPSPPPNLFNRTVYSNSAILR